MKTRRARQKARMRGIRNRTLIAAALIVAGVGAVLVIVELMDRAQLAVEAGEWESPALSPIIEDQERIRIEVLNGAGVAGAARAATDHLRDMGFDVVYYGNASTFGHDTTVVLDRTHRPEAAARVAGALGLSHGRSEPDSSLLVDVTVVLGADWLERVQRRVH